MTAVCVNKVFMILVMHKNLNLENWFKYSLNKQLANVGCDVSRAIRKRNENDFALSKKYVYAALELLDLIIVDPKHANKKCVEDLLQVRKAYIDYFMHDNEYQTSDQFWHNYFLIFNYMAAIEKGK